MHKGNATILVVSLLLILALGVGFYLYKNKAQSNYTSQYTPVYSASQMSQNSANPATNDSNAQLDQDLNSINTKINTVDTEQAGVNDGINQTAPNLGQ